MGQGRRGGDVDSDTTCRAEDDAAFDLGSLLAPTSGAAPRRDALADAGNRVVRDLVSGAAEPFPAGTELWSKRKLGYHHSGVYIGDGKVVHFKQELVGYVTSLGKGVTDAPVECTSLAAFAKGNPIARGPTESRYPRETIIQRALSYVGQRMAYSPTSHNCQHFSSLVVSGQAHSPEAELFARLGESLTDAVTKGVQSVSGARRS